MDRIGLPLPWGIVPAERLFRTVVGDDPAAGVEVSVTVPGGVVWWVLSVFITNFTTSVVAGNRLPTLAFDDGTTVFARSPIAGAILANGGVSIEWMASAGSPFRTGAAFDIAPLPPIPLLSGYRVRTITSGLDPGDNYTAPALYVAEYEIRGLERGVAKYLEALAAAGVEG